MQRTVKVVGKGLKGDKEKPIVTFKSENGDKISLILQDESQLSGFEIGEIWTVKVAKEQTKLV